MNKIFIRVKTRCYLQLIEMDLEEQDFETVEFVFEKSTKRKCSKAAARPNFRYSSA
jgi:hypothetical protein